MLRTLLTTSFALSLVVPTFGQAPARPAKPFTLTQVWTFDATYTDQQHGVTFRYPSVWQAGTGFGYHPPALTARSDEKPIAGFGYGEGGFPRDRVIGPYSATNLEGFGIVYSAIPVANLPNVRPGLPHCLRRQSIGLSCLEAVHFPSTKPGREVCRNPLRGSSTQHTCDPFAI